MTHKISASSYENSIAKTSLIIALVPAILLVIVLIQTPISIYLKIIIIIFCSAVIGIGTLLIWRRITNQLRTTTNIVEALITGDSTLRPSSTIQSGALFELNKVINIAANQLAEQRLLSKEHHIAMSKVLEHINIAVICFDENATITLLNPKAKQFFAVDYEMIGQPAKSLGIDSNLLTQKLQTVVTLTTEHFQKRVFLQTDSYQLHGKTHTLLFLNDVQKLLQNEERIAWQRLLRVMTHEINNSLAPIASIGESLSDILATNSSVDENKEDLTDGLNIITQRARNLNKFIKEYQSLTRLPQPSKTIFSIKKLLQEHQELFPNIQFAVDNSVDIEIFADKSQLDQVIINLYKNAGQSVDQVTQCQVNLQWSVANSLLKIQIIDNGLGIKNPDNLFIPFYTTKKQGSGIGLVLCRQILFNHGGDLSLSNNVNNKGAIATLSLPIMLQ
ncbi:PAS domain-containing sensor histidine kinase [Colwelliaceae bacterium 6441]